MKTKMIQRLPSLSAAMLALWVAAAAAATTEPNAETKAEAKSAAATAAAKPRFSIHLYTRSFLREGHVIDTAQGPSFTVTRREGGGRKKKSAGE